MNGRWKLPGRTEAATHAALGFDLHSFDMSCFLVQAVQAPDTTLSVRLEFFRLEGGDMEKWIESTAAAEGHGKWFGSGTSAKHGLRVSRQPRSLLWPTSNTLPCKKELGGWSIVQQPEE